jgi:hypothetical protein
VKEKHSSGDKRFPSASVVEAYQNKTVDFKFRGRNFHFSLSQSLFSSADIDTGTRFLLKSFSRLLDENSQRGAPPPGTVLDAGCGTGIIGICAAGALSQGTKPPGLLSPVAGTPDAGSLYVRAQDRDELARRFTEYNAGKNDVSPSLLSVHTEPLLAGPPGVRWDLILSNIPAKAGKPVLEDFVFRSLNLLTPEGRVLIVAVNSLGNFFRSRINAAGALLLRDEPGREHTVFTYGSVLPQSPVKKEGPEKTGPLHGGASFIRDFPFYLRTAGDYELEEITYRIEAFEGVPDFDAPGGAVQGAVKLLPRLKTAFPWESGGGDRTAGGPASPGKDRAPAILIYEPGQGHFPAWLVKYLERRRSSGAPLRTLSFTFSGRNILALEAARHNTLLALGVSAGFCPWGFPPPHLGTIRIVPSVDLSPGEATAIQGPDPPGERGFSYDFIAAFPESAPRAGGLGTLWAGLVKLLAPGGMVLAAFSSAQAEQFNRKKPKEFTRLGDLKRNGFRALAYRRAAETGGEI